MERFQKIYEQMSQYHSKLNNACIEYLKALLDKNGGIFDLSQISECCFVTYDGGRHPEYASNAFSVVSTIHYDSNHQIVLDIDDTEDYELDRINLEELYNLCLFVSEFLEEELTPINALDVLPNNTEDTQERIQEGVSKCLEYMAKCIKVKKETDELLFTFNGGNVSVPFLVENRVVAQGRVDMPHDIAVEVAKIIKSKGYYVWTHTDYQGVVSYWVTKHNVRPHSWYTLFK